MAIEIKDLPVGLVEFYDDSPACAVTDRLVREVRALLGADAPIYRVNVSEDPRERSLVHLDVIPTIIIYRDGREEWRITSNFPSAQVLADRLEASMQAPGAVNPLKGHPRN